MGKVRRKYDKGFKKEAVLLVIERDRPVSEVARDLWDGLNLMVLLLSFFYILDCCIPDRFCGETNY